MRMLVPSALLAAALVAPARADDFVLTIGGGYSPSGNQVSLEKNVLFFDRVLDEKLPASHRHTLLFADGDDPRRDVQYLDLETPIPRAEALLARVLNQTEHQFERYRNHELPHDADAATRANLSDWFDTVGRTLTDGDTLLIYVTAHGGPSEDKKRPRNSRLHLWDGDDVTVAEFAEELDKIAPQVPVVIVMVQCYSGGFADLIFEDGDEEHRLTGRLRCGFFATTHDRVAAGCTADIDEADYQEYSSAFWAAILGRSRVGEPVASADFDDDGVVSFAEAHASVLIHSDTIDIPVKTSDAFLRRLSSEVPPSVELLAGPTEGQRESSAVAGDAGQTVTALKPVATLNANSNIESLLAGADPAARAVVVRLSERLELSRPDRAAEARDRAEQIEAEQKRLRGRVGRLNRDVRRMRGEIEDAVLAEWPELAGIWNTEARRLVAEEPDAIVELIESHPRFERWETLEEQAYELELRRDDLERDWVKCQRLIATLETIALAHNLPLVADSSVQSQFARLQALESATLARR